MAWTQRELRRLARDMENWDGGQWCVFCILLLASLLVIVASFVIAFNAKVVGYSIMLAPCALWLFLIFCGWTLNPGLDPCANRPTFLCCSCLAILVFGLVTAFSFAIVFFSHHKQENKVNFDASNATLTRFNFTSSNNNSILTYHLSLNVNIGPNKEKTGVYYHTIQAWAFYQGQNFTSLSIPPSYLGGKKNHIYNSTVVLHPVFQGQQLVVLTGDGLRRYKKETAAGRYSIDVTLSYLGMRTNDYNDHNRTATHSDDMLNKAGHQLKGVVTFGLKLPLSSDVAGIALARSGATKNFEY